MASRRPQHNTDHPLKAVLFADACSPDRPPPLSADKPVANVPLLVWQLTALARFGVQHVVILSSQPLDRVPHDPLRRLHVTPLSSPAWTSPADALRDLDSRHDLRPVDDFILVHPFALFNLDLSALVAEHRARRLADPNWLITAVFRRCAGAVPTHLTIAVDHPSSTLLSYIPASSSSSSSSSTQSHSTVPRSVPFSLIPPHASHHASHIKLYTHVLDVGLDVCAPEFLQEFRENFFYSHIRSYVQEKLDGPDAEVFGNRMYAHFLDSSARQYATNVSSLAMLAQATSDVLNGWMAPVAPFTNPSRPSSPPSESSHHGNYVTDRVALGQDVAVGVGTTIIDSVIGNLVTIGNDVTISHTIIADGCIIGDRADITSSILDTHAHVQSDSCIPSNCYLDQNVCLGIDHQPLPPYSFVTLREPHYFGSGPHDSSDPDPSDPSDDDPDSLLSASYPDNPQTTPTTSQNDHPSATDHKPPVHPDASEPTADQPNQQTLDTPQKVPDNDEPTAENGTASDDDDNHDDDNEDGDGDGDGDGDDDDDDGDDDDDDDDDDDGHADLTDGAEGEYDRTDDAMTDLGFVAHGTVVSGQLARYLDRFFEEREISSIEYVSEDVDELEEDSEDDDSNRESDDEDPQRDAQPENGVVDIADDVGHISLGNDSVLEESDDRLKMFIDEVLDTMEIGFHDSVEIDNTSLEINGLKLSYNATFAETMSCVVGGIARAVKRRAKGDVSYQEVWAALRRYHNLIDKFSKEGDADYDCEVVRLIITIVGTEEGVLLQYILKVLFDEDLVEEEGILKWKAEEQQRVDAGKASGSLLESLRPFLEWLEEEDEEDEEDKDSGGEED